MRYFKIFISILLISSASTVIAGQPQGKNYHACNTKQLGLAPWDKSSFLLDIEWSDGIDSSLAILARSDGKFVYLFSVVEPDIWVACYSYFAEIDKDTNQITLILPDYFETEGDHRLLIVRDAEKNILGATHEYGAASEGRTTAQAVKITRYTN